ncbi:RNA polymerase factor sigma-54 [Bacillus sp. PS06]|uniref:RNA polymerase factor sigma-54 n=1 Tax=Bacillus sp. PS06 TaxID=2764176 RepID=UPI00178648CD|nr:RNA polymerase factor sigma-54 [Bacillus sp. PS06]MBD8070788.1 RNA polymerase factor sigma-54 [Bacillus sp. PS06]
MDLTAGLFQQQSQKLVLTKELTQAITLLQYSTVELHDFLHQQSLENPLIEIKDTRHRSMKVRGNQIQATKNPIDYLAHHHVSLSEHLCGQLVNFHLSKKEIHQVEYIINSLDVNGYLRYDEKEIAADLGIEIEEVQKAISIVQQLEPAGVAARNLQECLLLQLKRLPIHHSLARPVLTDHFELFATKSWKKLASTLKVQLKEIQALYDAIQLLDPRPGSQYSTMTTNYIRPDLKVEFIQGDLVVSLIEENSPKLSINKQYYQLKETNPEAKSYLESKYDQYLWIQKSIEQRKRTISNVMAEITKRQSSFFLKGPLYLEPLTMSDIAEALEIHESTVSRASKGKYVQTPHGTYEIRSFFSNQVNDKSTTEVSSAHVKHLVKELIEQENKQKPLSDQQIVSSLEVNHQISVSRRTIAKYRDQLGILGSSKRKRF